MNKPLTLLLLLLIAWTTPLKGEGVRVFSYNILSDLYLHKESYEGTPPEVLIWSTRKWLLLDRMTKLNADVLCLQELTDDAYVFFEKNLGAMGYLGEFSRDAGHHQIGVGTFYKDELLYCLGSRSIECEGSSLGGKAVQSALISEFILHDGQMFNLINTKMKWMPEATPTEQHPGWKQTIFLIHEIIAKCPETEWVILGDFNVECDHEIIRTFENYGFYDPFTTLDPPTCFAENVIKRIDYVLVTASLLTNPLETPKLTEVLPIPSAKEPSDHLPIGLEIVISSPKN